MKKYILLLSIISVMQSCTSSVKDQNQLIGYWSHCLRDGSYQELIFSEDKIYLLDQFTSKDEIGTFQYNIIKDSLIGYGITKNTPQSDTFRMHINIISARRILLTNQFVRYDLIKLEDPISDANTWAKKALIGIDLREEEYGCQDIRTEEEKELIDLGTADNDFEELTEIPFTEELDSLKNKR